ncbi:unnamed protein product, partial [Polarella glacialis]
MGGQLGALNRSKSTGSLTRKLSGASSVVSLPPLRSALGGHRAGGHDLSQRSSLPPIVESPAGGWQTVALPADPEPQEQNFIDDDQPTDTDQESEGPTEQELQHMADVEAKLEAELAAAFAELTASLTTDGNLSELDSEMQARVARLAPRI